MDPCEPIDLDLESPEKHHSHGVIDMTDLLLDQCLNSSRLTLRGSSESCSGDDRSITLNSVCDSTASASNLSTLNSQQTLPNESYSSPGGHKRHQGLKEARLQIGTYLDPVNVLDDEEEEEDDDDEEDLMKTVVAAYPLLSHTPRPSSLKVMQAQYQAVDLDRDETEETALVIEDDDRFNGLTHAISIIDLEIDDEAPTLSTPEAVIQRSLRINGVTCAARKTVEFTDGTFMRIHSVFKTSLEKVCLFGKVFVRQNSFREKVPKRRNEVIWTGMARKEVDQGELVRNRQLFMTNRRYPEVSTRNHQDSWLDPNQDVILGPLFCRWKRTTKISGIRLQFESWESLQPNDADPGMQTCITESAKRFNFRKCATIPGGSFIETLPVVDLDTGSLEHEQVSQQYTFGDAFCGAGGTSCGAQMAGMKLAWSFDYDSKAIATYRSNFPEAECLPVPVHDFIGMAREDYQRYRVDVLHISPPCQPFSPAHTVPSQHRDEMNQAALFSVGELIECIKPRIVTIEETEGLVSRHGEWFAALIHIFLRIGYSVSWKIIKCGDYGIPQPNRRRLTIIAAGPGETLPEFPEPTHSQDPNMLLERIPTIGDRIRDLEGYPNHDTTVLRQNRQQPFSPDTYAYTLTCNSGVGNYHPSGLRNYTVRELACLQTFPRSFKFADVGVTSQRRQIGNAVPPELSKALMKSIINSLQQSDSRDKRRLSAKL